MIKMLEITFANTEDGFPKQHMMVEVERVFYEQATQRTIAQAAQRALRHELDRQGFMFSDRVFVELLA
jgi:hypothetical protein